MAAIAAVFIAPLSIKDESILAQGWIRISGYRHSSKTRDLYARYVEGRWVNMQQTQKCIEYAESLKDSNPDANKLWVMANKEMSIMLRRYDQLKLNS